VISIAFRSARVIMCIIQLFSIVPENSRRRKGHFEQKDTAYCWPAMASEKSLSGKTVPLQLLSRIPMGQKTDRVGSEN
jgi:hypothetical protein